MLHLQSRKYGTTGYENSFQVIKICELKPVAIRKYKIKVDRIIICLAITLREKRKLRVLKNRVLRRIFGPRRDEVTGEWRRLHKMELYSLYSSTNVIRLIKSRRIRWARHVARTGR